MRGKRWLLVLAGLVAVGAATGAYLGGQSVGVCVVGPSLPPQPATCETDLRLSLLGGAIGALAAALLGIWGRSRRRG